MSYLPGTRYRQIGTLMFKLCAVCALYIENNRLQRFQLFWAARNRGPMSRRTYKFGELCEIYSPTH